MKKQYYLMSIFLLSILLFNINFTLTIASGENDDDGINDDFEEKNKRHIEVGIGENEIVVESVRRSEVDRDEIRAFIFFDEDGLYIGLRYRSKLESDCELEFGILFHEIIEYNDTNKNGMYNPDIDHRIKTLPLNDFKPVFYETSDISGDTSLHYFKIQTVNNIFTACIYFVEEFVVIEKSLITPTQAKIDIAISNYEFESESSQLALYTILDYGEDYEIKEETEDEKEGYAENENGVITTSYDFTGYFTWRNSAVVDKNLENILVNEVNADEYDEYGQGLFINYPNGEHIYHDPKIGIENVLIPIDKPDSLIPLIILISVIGAVSASSAYAINYYVKHRGVTLKLDRDREAYFSESFENGLDEEPYEGKLALQILAGENAIEKLSLINNINITAISEEFFEKLNRFEWESFDRSEFILEMLALSPKERLSILDEMIEKTHLI
ncbi:MAG: hypothetical protein KAW51_08240 [Candidatus Lokiarchaeota archaeon]|nr:hypothetical protein [Candidatus Lokiarchaeota archaeon]